MNPRNKSQVLLCLYLDLSKGECKRSAILAKYALEDRTLRRYLSELRDLGFQVVKERFTRTEFVNRKPIEFRDEKIKIVEVSDDQSSTDV